MGSNWLDPRMRVPLIGIIAMVAIVAVVAVFLRSGLDGILPEQDVRVTGENENTNLRGGAATFSGYRVIGLTYQDMLEGVFVRQGDSVSLLVDTSDNMLYLVQGGMREEVVLSLTPDNLGLTSTFEHGGQQVTVTVYSAERTLTWLPAGDLSVTVDLAETTRYLGVFLYDGEQYDVDVNPGEPSVMISREASTWDVPLTPEGPVLHGMWRTSDGVSHPIKADLQRLEFTVSELW